jgi:hypothetical protein
MGVKKIAMPPAAGDIQHEFGLRRAKSSSFSNLSVFNCTRYFHLVIQSENLYSMCYPEVERI